MSGDTHHLVASIVDEDILARRQRLAERRDLEIQRVRDERAKAEHAAFWAQVEAQQRPSRVVRMAERARR